MTEAFPLSWPQGWPRHRGDRDSERRFHGPTYRWDRVYRGLVDELRRIGATRIVVSTNQPVRQDGAPYAQQRVISDPGVAVYFTRGRRSLVMAQDRFETVLGNMRSLAMAIEGLRQMERHGGALMLERAFDGFAALPPPEDCWTVLGLRKDQAKTYTTNDVTVAFRHKVRELHGTGADMDRVTKARDTAMAYVDG